MEFLIGVLISWALQTLKWVSSKIGSEMTKGITVVALFVCVFAVTFFKETGRLPMEFITQLYSIFVVAVINYEIVIKKVIKPLLEKI